MNFLEFKAQFQNRPLIKSKDVIRTIADPQVMRNQMHRWQKKGLLISLRKGFYILNTNDRKVDVDPSTIAGMLYEPSYLSLEYALGYYGFIPEAVADKTSVTTRKTMSFSTSLGVFSYQHVKPGAFRGFRRVADNKVSFFIAEPEKAIVDFLYFNLAQFNNNVREVLEQSYRFQNIEDIDTKKLLELGKLFNNKKLMKVLKDLIDWVKELRL